MRNILTLSLTAIAFGIAAATPQDLSSVRGTGQLVVNGRTQDIRQIRVNLQNNGRAEIIVTANRTEILTGSWYDRRNGEYDIEISSGFGSTDTTGNGRLTMANDRRTITSIDLAGRSRNGRWSLDFNSERGNQGGIRPGQPFELIGTERGDGTLNYQGRHDIRQASLRLERNGNFSIEVFGNRRQNIEGTWRADNRGRITLTINEAFTRRNARGTGTVTLTPDRRRFTEMRLNGTIGRERFDFNFDVDRRNDDRWGDRPGDRDFPGFDTTESGSGTIIIAGQGGVNVTSVRANLRSNGDITIDTRGPQNYSVSGTWRMTSSGIIEFSIDNGFGRDGARGVGRITMGQGNRSFSRLDMSGSTNGRNFSLGFVVTRGK